MTVTDMDCDAVRAALPLYLDGELDAEERAAFEGHLAACADCRAAVAAARAMSEAFRSEIARARAPAGLAARVHRALAADAPRAAARRWYRTGPALATASLALFLLGAVAAHWGFPSGGENAALRDVVAAHVRALMSERLIDVASSDQHTVKPWFDGRVELAPPVEDLTAEGFQLVGGRVDYVNERRVAALVYRHRQHVLTLFVGPAGAAPGGEAARQGYSVVHWTSGGMNFWAVSDLNPEELARFSTLLRARLAAGGNR